MLLEHAELGVAYQVFVMAITEGNDVSGSVLDTLKCACTWNSPQGVVNRVNIRTLEPTFPDDPSSCTFSLLIVWLYRCQR